MQSIILTSPSVEVHVGHLNQHFTVLSACLNTILSPLRQSSCVGLAAGVKDEVKRLVCLRSPRRCGNILKTGTEGTKPTGKTKWSNSDNTEQWNFTNAEQFPLTSAHTGTNAPNKKTKTKKTPNKTVQTTHLLIFALFIYVLWLKWFFFFFVKSDLSHFGTWMKWWLWRNLSNFVAAAEFWRADF